MVLEVPSGTLGDLVSRKTLVVLSGVIKGCCYPTWLLWPDFYGYLLGFFLWGLGSSLRSGTAESLLHDTLVEHDAAHRFERVYGRGRAAEGLGVGAAFLVGGLIAEGGYTWPLALSAVGPFLASGVAALGFREPLRSGTAAGSEKAESAGGSYFSVLRQGIVEVRGSPRILSIIGLFAGAITVSGGAR